MNVHEAEKYLRWRFKGWKNKKDLEALNVILKTATYDIDTEVGFIAFCRLWLFVSLSYPDDWAHREFYRIMALSLPSTIYRINEVVKGAELEDIPLDLEPTKDEVSEILNTMFRRDEKELELYLRNLYNEIHQVRQSPKNKSDV